MSKIYAIPPGKDDIDRAGCIDRNSMRVDEGRQGWWWSLLAMIIKARTVVGKGGEEPVW